MTTSTREIEERAYARWVESGHPHDTAVGDWLSAEAELGLARAAALQLFERSPPESVHLLQAILDHATAVISVKDRQGRYLLVNGRFEALFRISADEVMGKTDFDLFPGDKAETLRANDLQVLGAGRPLEFEEVVPQDGGEHTYLSLKFPISGPGGAVYAVCGISTDITERKQAQRLLAAQYAVTRALTESATLSDAGPGILRTVCECLGWDVGLLWIVDPFAGRLRCVELWHLTGVSTPGFDRTSRELLLPPGVELAGRVWETGRSVWVGNVVDTVTSTRSAAALREELHWACGFPVRNGGAVLGVVEFFSRVVREPDEELIRVLGGIGGQMSQFIERRQAERNVHERGQELRVAREIQQRLLPRGAPRVAGFAAGGASHPAQETGGDYLDFIPLPDGSLGVAVGDASGHGVGAALVMAETRAYLRARAATDTDVAAVLGLLNRQLADDLPADHFVTLFLARLDAGARSLTYASAGHWPGYVLDGWGEVRATLPSTGLPLGVDPAADFAGAPAFPLRPGDLVVLLTDGVLEASAPDGPLFGVDRALAVVRACRGAAPGEIAAVVLREAHAFSGQAPVDDMTAVVVKVDGAGRVGRGQAAPDGARGLLLTAHSNGPVE